MNQRKETDQLSLVFERYRYTAGWLSLAVIILGLTLLSCTREIVSAESLLDDACHDLADAQSFDITYAVTHTTDEGIRKGTWEVRMNGGNYHLVETYSTAIAEKILFDGVFYFRTQWSGEEPGEWRRIDNIRFEKDADTSTSDSTSQSPVCSYATDSRFAGGKETTLNGVKVRHIVISKGSAASISISEEYWITLSGRLVQHKGVVITSDTRTEHIGVVSGIGEPNVITAPEVPAPSP